MDKNEGMATIAEHLTDDCPGDAQNGISLAYAKRPTFALQTAEKTLLEAQKHFPEETRFPSTLLATPVSCGDWIGLERNWRRRLEWSQRIRRRF